MEKRVLEGLLPLLASHTETSPRVGSCGGGAGAAGLREASGS